MQSYNTKTSSLQTDGGMTKPAELYIPLWWSSTQQASGSATTSPQWIRHGFSSLTASPTILITLSNDWPPDTLFALEAFLYTNGTITYSRAQLYDVNASSGVGPVIEGNNLNHFVLTRSSTFTLIAGRSYGVMHWASNTSNSTYIIDISLVAFPQ